MRGPIRTAIACGSAETRVGNRGYGVARTLRASKFAPPAHLKYPPKARRYLSGTTNSQPGNRTRARRATNRLVRKEVA